MTKKIFITPGSIFNNWKLIKEVKPKIKQPYNRRAKFVCICNRTKILFIGSVIHGKTKSCGCVRDKIFKELRKTHGMSQTKIYGVWRSMLSRCNNKNQKAYKNYGAKGIKVSKKWMSFTQFYSDMGTPLKGFTLERVNTLLGYSKENCRWATYKEQARNKTNSKFIKFDGDTKTLAEWCEIYKISATKVNDRVSRNWSMKQVFGLEKRNRIWRNQHTGPAK